MSLFNSKKTPASPKVSEEKDEKKKAVTANASIPASTGARSLAHILKHARITEKATMHQGASVYTFDVAVEATKRDIIHAVRALYKVSPRKVAIVTIRSKKRRNMRTGRTGVTRGGKKAYIYLKQGDTITIS